MEIYKKSKYIGNSFISAVQKRINGNFAEHGHDFFEIEFVIDGTGTYIVDGISYPIGKNMLFFMSPANIHAIKNCDAEIINVMFSCHLFSVALLFPLFAPNAVNVVQFSDYDAVSDWAAEYVDAVYEAGIFKGDDAGCFNGKSSLTRAETATIIYRLSDKNSGGGIAE